jgi:hypothetical protein
VPLEDPGGNGGGEAGIGGEGRLDVGREFGPDVVCPKLADTGDVVAGLEGEPSRGVDGPDAIAGAARTAARGDRTSAVARTRVAGL